jgi:hypothetical protein
MFGEAYLNENGRYSRDLAVSKGYSGVRFSTPLLKHNRGDRDRRWIPRISAANRPAENRHVGTNRNRFRVCEKFGAEITTQVLGIPVGVLTCGNLLERIFG